jgi:hypothetical protein
MSIHRQSALQAHTTPATENVIQVHPALGEAAQCGDSAKREMVMGGWRVPMPLRPDNRENAERNASRRVGIFRRRMA